MDKSDKNLKQEDRDKLRLKIDITQLEVLVGIDKTMQQLLIVENERKADEWKEKRRISIEQNKQKAFLERIRKGKLKQKKTNPYKVLEELPK